VRDVEPRYHLSRIAMACYVHHVTCSHFKIYIYIYIYLLFLFFFVFLNAFVPVRAPATHRWLMMSHLVFYYSPNAVCLRTRMYVFCIRTFGWELTPHCSHLLDESLPPPLLLTDKLEKKRERERERALIGWVRRD
jgi:hypothetical protein